MIIFPMLETAKLNGLGARELGLAPLSNMALNLPLDHYFYVARENSEILHQALFEGLIAAIADGSHEKLLSTHPGTRDAYADLLREDVVTLKLENPYLSDETMAIVKTYELAQLQKK